MSRRLLDVRDQDSVQTRSETGGMGEEDDEKSEAEGSAHAAMKVRSRGAHTSSREVGRSRGKRLRRTVEGASP
jgi:hypothetical protein